MATCLSLSDVSRQLLLIASALFSSTLLQGWLTQGFPAEKVGVRSKGSGLCGWLISYYVSGDGIAGYDPVLGAFGPPLRFRMHIAAVIFFWAAASAFLGSVFDHTCTRGGFPREFYHTGAFSLLAYLVVSFVVHRLLPGVSLPGGPRTHKIDRYPEWPVNKQRLNVEGWTFATGQDGHEITEQVFSGTAGALTGEPTGRDIWYHQASPRTYRGVDEVLVQELASGGRTEGFQPNVNPNSNDAVFRAQQIREYLAAGGTAPGKDAPKNVAETLEKAVHFFSMLQTKDGHWSGDYGGPMFLMPGLIVAWYIMGKPDTMFGKEHVEAMKYYLVVHQQVDGGWGTHIESPSTMFGTVLNYVSLRLLGMNDNNPVCVRGRAFMKEHGGALMTSSWAKFYLCLLGVMHWDGHNSVPPEMWLLPDWFPFHPGRMWCHARMVYLPMGYLYGIRFVYGQAGTDPLVWALRRELYCQDYDQINWMSTRHWVASIDNYSPLPWPMKIAQNVLARYETWAIFQPIKNLVRKHGLSFCLDYMRAEDLQTNYIDIGPVNKVLNMLSAYHAAGCDIHETNVANHLARVQDYLWVAEDGMKMKGYNGSQCWDTSFAVQAIYEAGLVDKFPNVSRKVWSYLERCQILSTEVSQGTAAFRYESPENRRKYYRHVSQGGWPFSTR